MTVQDRCRELQLRVSRSRAREQDHKGAEELRHRAADVLKVNERLKPVVEKAAVLQRHEVVLPELADTAKAVSALREYREGLGTEMIGGGQHFKRLTRAIEKIIEVREVQISGALEALDRASGAPDDSILSVLQEFPGKKAEAARIRAELKAIPSWRRLLTASAEELESALKRRRNIQAQLERLMGDVRVGEMPSEVRKFFRELSESRAVPFERLTPTVQEWLQSRELLKHLRVSFANG